MILNVIIIKKVREELFLIYYGEEKNYSIKIENVTKNLKYILINQIL